MFTPELIFKSMNLELSYWLFKRVDIDWEKVQSLNMGKSGLALTSAGPTLVALGLERMTPCLTTTPSPASDIHPDNYSGRLRLSPQWDDSFCSTVFKIINFKDS